MEEEGTVETYTLGGVGFLDGRTIGGGVDGAVLGLAGLIGWHLFVCETMRLWEWVREKGTT